MWSTWLFMRRSCDMLVGREVRDGNTPSRPLQQASASCRRDHGLLRGLLRRLVEHRPHLLPEQLLRLRRLPAARAAVVADQQELVEAELVPEIDELLAHLLRRARIDDLVLE